ncbi:Inherit from strNOG: K03714 glycoprotein 2-beta-D-xylosyltransferase [Seminavis robusta]|uniref:Inherit from strNOG: K03714 glycoprotein 2-beta-D-xylosyltransferase n=1 Tax=Seminavis robusta TaxID=568900 RepID=A0A9N8E648_9STRA|nr:Inherit from strNOG: K03714 glycoprotein 2-beta-D-xylosyltransferase [Seminavis robusta]|eukprot:Sro538_g162460.1 Inherit from strNOG: K03714 glycoprotein 2-beta-D-xylosyltransferase EC 2.4.2.38 (563) ;mRNA; f:2068-3756
MVQILHLSSSLPDDERRNKLGSSTTMDHRHQIHVELDPAFLRHGGPGPAVPVQPQHGASNPKQDDNNWNVPHVPDSMFQKPDTDRCSQFLGNSMSNSEARFFSLCSDDMMMGMLWCEWNPVLESSFCQANNLIVDASKITVSKGGESIQQVMGRPEAEELPTFQPGALHLSQCVPNQNHINPKDLPFHLFDMFQSILDEGTSHDVECTAYEERPTLIITRYEYANLYHTYSDWYSAYQSAMIALQGNQTAVENVHIVFFDGHAQANTDMGWKLLFSNATVSYISEYKNDKKEPACFRNAIFVPAGYTAPTSVTSIERLGMGEPAYKYIDASCQKNKWQQRFREMMVGNSKRYLIANKATTRLNLLLQDDNNSHQDPNSQKKMEERKQRDNQPTLRVMLLSRTNYQSHPRMDGTVSRIIQNEEEILHFLEHYKGPDEPMGILSKANFPTVIVNRVVLEEHDVAEQIVMFQQADVVVGMHGAGLSHIFLARPGTVLLEIKPHGYSDSMRHFQYLAQMAGCIHRPRDLRTDDDPYPVPISDFEQSFKESVTLFLGHQNKLIASQP